MLRRISPISLGAIGVRFASEMTKPVTTALIASSDPFQDRKGYDPNELLVEFTKKAEDPMLYPKTKVNHWVDKKNPDNYLYNRGTTFVPTPAEHNSRCGLERFQLGQIRSKNTLMGAVRHESDAAIAFATARGHLLPRHNNFAKDGTKHIRCKDINPLEHNMSNTNKFGKFGKVTKAIRGGTYLRL